MQEVTGANTIRAGPPMGSVAWNRQIQREIDRWVAAYIKITLMSTSK